MRKILLGIGLFFISSVALFTQEASARELTGRLGVGYSQQLQNDIPSIDFKIQRSKVYAMGLLVGVNLNDTQGGWGAGLKLYRIIFEEPQLTFYAAGLAAAINTKTNSNSSTGFQVDGTLGTEFSFSGLESVGFSFEMGFSLNKVQDEVSFETVGNSIIVAGVHFYI